MDESGELQLATQAVERRIDAYKSGLWEIVCKVITVLK
jgi:hypothetical protein